MTTQHAAIQSAECHEPKHITSATTADSGKVLTPSSSVAGASVLRNLNTRDVLPLVVALTDAATITCNANVTDMGTVTLGGNRTLGAPTGTPYNGQMLVYRVTQDGTGGRTLSFNSIFTFIGGIPSPDLSANTFAYYAFRWNSATSKWEQFIRPIGGQSYVTKTITANTTVTAVPAMTDATNFSTLADWRQVTGIFDGVDTVPASNFTSGTDTITTLITGVYKLDYTATIAAVAGSSNIGINFGVNGVVQTARTHVQRVVGANDRNILSGHLMVTLPAGTVLSVWVANTSATNLTISNARFTAVLVNRTA